LVSALAEIASGRSAACLPGVVVGLGAREVFPGRQREVMGLVNHTNRDDADEPEGTDQNEMRAVVQPEMS